MSEVGEHGRGAAWAAALIGIPGAIVAIIMVALFDGSELDRLGTEDTAAGGAQ